MDPRNPRPVNRSAHPNVVRETRLNMGRPALLETFWQDLRFGARALFRSPGFAAIAVLTLALGIGANASIFSVLNAVLLRPLPWSEPDRAVMIWSKWTAFDKTWVAAGEVVDYRKRATTFAEVAAWSDGAGQSHWRSGARTRRGGQRDRQHLLDARRRRRCSAERSQRRRTSPTAQGSSSLGMALWNRRYSADPSIVGRAILVNGNAYEVVGVMPPGFVLPTDYRSAEPSQLWTPLQLNPTSMDHGSHGYYAAGRAEARRDGAPGRGRTPRHCSSDDQRGLVPSPDAVRHGRRCRSKTRSSATFVESIWLLFGAVGFLLLIACANVANLLLARAEARQREMAVRSALGASSLRMLRQLLTESLVLTGVSAMIGLGLAFAAVRVVAWWNPADIPRVAGVTLDLRVLVFTARRRAHDERVVQPRAGAARLKVDLTDSLKDGGQSGSSGASRQRFRNALVVVADGAGRAALGRRRADASQSVVASARPDRLRPVERADDARLAADDKLSERRNRSLGSTSA